jgi:hypothetical protein
MLFELEAWPEDVSIPAASTMPRNRPQFEGSGPVLCPDEQIRPRLMPVRRARTAARCATESEPG